MRTDGAASRARFLHRQHERELESLRVTDTAAGSATFRGGRETPRRGDGTIATTGFRWLQGVDEAAASSPPPPPPSRQPHVQPAGICLSAHRRPGPAPRSRKAHHDAHEAHGCLCTPRARPSRARPSRSSAGRPSRPAAIRSWLRSVTRQGPYCGGTLIAPRVVLTAAHCLTIKPTGLGQLRVFAGSRSISADRSAHRTARTCRLDRRRRPPEVQRADDALRRRAPGPRPPVASARTLPLAERLAARRHERQRRRLGHDAGALRAHARSSCAASS